MKPYKIITTFRPMTKKRVVGPLPIKKVPLTFFSNTHSPPKTEYVLTPSPDPQS